MRPGQHRYYRLDLKPDLVTSGKIKYTRNDLHHWSPEGIFAEDDLYTTRWGSITNVEIEQFFFGQLDTKAPSAVDFFANFDLEDINKTALETLMTYMSVQKVRTPKGLAVLTAQTRSEHSNLTLISLQELKICIARFGRSVSGKLLMSLIPRQNSSSRTIRLPSITEFVRRSLGGATGTMTQIFACTRHTRTFRYRLIKF
jgi:hypothetical protein